VHPADRAVVGKPALALGVMDHPAARRSLRTGYPLEDRRTQAATHQLSGIPYSHPAILSRASTRTVRGRPGKAGPMPAGGSNTRRRWGGGGLIEWWHARADDGPVYRMVTARLVRPCFST
jgi:hypothetical protein